MNMPIRLVADGETPRDPVAEIVGRIASRDCCVGIIGLGYVGLPLALTSIDRGFTVLGFDVDEGRVASLNAGKSLIEHIPDDKLAEAVAAERFAATADMARLGEADAILIAVPTPLSRHQEPDLSYVENSTRAIAAPDAARAAI